MICFVPHIIYPLNAFILKEVMFIQVDDGLAHMLDEVFDVENLENMSSGPAPKTNN